MKNTIFSLIFVVVSLVMFMGCNNEPVKKPVDKVELSSFYGKWDLKVIQDEHGLPVYNSLPDHMKEWIIINPDGIILEGFDSQVLRKYIYTFDILNPSVLSVTVLSDKHSINMEKWDNSVVLVEAFTDQYGRFVGKKIYSQKLN